MSEFVTIARFYQVVEADAARLALEHAGIGAHFEGVNIITADFLLSNAVGGVKLLVAEKDVEAAQRVLESASRGTDPADQEQESNSTSHRAPQGALDRDEIVFCCSECGATIRFAAALADKCETCPRCHEYVDVPELPQLRVEADIEPTRAELPILVSTSTSDESDAIEVLTPAVRSAGWLELLLVLCIAYFPHLYSSVDYVLNHPSPTELQASDQSYDYPYEAFSSATTCLLVLYLISRNGEPWSLFGVTPIHWLKDPLWALGCLAIGVLGSDFGLRIVDPTQMQGGGYGHAGLLVASFGDWAKSHSAAAHIFPIMATCIAAYAEELVYRGYLITRLTQLLRSTAGAVLVATILFASFHIYQGFANTISIGVSGFLFCLMFLVLRRLWPLAIAHALHNLFYLYG